jgi:hypothetical protein
VSEPEREPESEAETETEQSEHRNPLVAEGLLALELTALSAFAVSRPVLDSFGRSPETFVARGADGRTVVLFGLVVALVPALVLAGLGLASRPLGDGARRAVHLALVAVAGGIAVWRLGQDVTGWPGSATKLLLAGVVGGPALAAIRWRVPPSRTFLRFAGAASAVFLIQFLALSPASSLVLGGGPEVDADVAADVSASLDGDPPDVVVVVFDALPTMSLLDGTGHLDEDLVPNFAALVDTSTWYRNNSSVAAFTGEAVPAILTGRYPDADVTNGTPPADPENLFTLLGGSYDVHAKEQVTRLCPTDLCPREEPAGLSRLLGDAVDLWGNGASEDDGDGELDLPGALGPDRFAEAERWIDQQDYRADSGPDSRPDLFFLHVVLPHEAWQFLPDGRPYEPASDVPTGAFGLGWTESGTAVGRQRHLMQVQAADRLLGDVLDHLRDAGTFDDSLVVVTADHGEAFTTGEPSRGLSEGNYPEIAWTPLLVKEPGQASAEVNDDNVQVIDIVPTIADRLGIDMPWDVDGRPVGEAGVRDPDVKPYDDSEHNSLRADDGEPRVDLDARAGFERVLAADSAEGEGPDGVWKRTEHGDLFGREVADLDVGSAVDASVAVDHLGRLGSIDVDEPLPIEVVGNTDLPLGTIVAYALNGTIGAVTEVETGVEAGSNLAHALLPPDVFVDGDNELRAYVVGGEPGSETLRPIEVGD